MNLDAFSSGNLQTIKVFLNLAVENGVSDVSELSRLISEKLERDRQAFLVEHPEPQELPPSDKLLKVNRTPCPECGNPTQRMLVDGNIILSCKKCRWSTLITGDSNGLR